MGWVTKFAKSSIGAKMIMALTGIILFGFVLVHMLGNLQVYLGQEPYNAYANFLKSTPELLWPARIVLILAVITHIASAFRLAAINAAARPHAYKQKHFTKATITSRTMVYTGSLILVFIVYHLLHFTAGIAQPETFHLVDGKQRHDVYSMFVLAFQNIWIAGGYVVAMLCLFPHLEHGVSSLFQSLGLNHPRYNTMLGRIGPVFASIVVLGNISMPVAVQLGLLTLPAGVP